MSKNKELTKEAAEVKKEKSSGGSKALTIIGIVLCVILLPILIVNVTMIIKSYTNPDKYPSFAGVSMMIVLSPSMESTINEGDLIVVKSADPTEVVGESAEGKGDGTVISFFDPDSKNNAVLTHRCVKVITNDDGSLSFITKGDNNDSEDLKPVPAENLIGTYVFRLPGFGNIAMWLQSTPGLIVCIAVPIVLLVGYDLIMKKRYDKKKKTDTDALLAELDALRAQAAANSAKADNAEAAPAAEAAPTDVKPVEDKPAEVKSADVKPDDEQVKTPAEVKPASEVDSDMAKVDALIKEITDEDKNS